MYILPLSSSLTDLYYLYNFLLCFYFLFIKWEDLIPWSVRFLPTLSGTLPRLNKYINEEQFRPRWSSPIPPTPVSYSKNTKHNNTTKHEKTWKAEKEGRWPLTSELANDTVVSSLGYSVSSMSRIQCWRRLQLRSTNRQRNTTQVCSPGRGPEKGWPNRTENFFDGICRHPAKHQWENCLSHSRLHRG